MNEDMKIGAKIALEGVKEELIKVRAELKRIREGRKADVDKSDQNSRSKDIKPKGQKQLAHRQPNIKKKKNIKER